MVNQNVFYVLDNAYRTVLQDLFTQVNLIMSYTGLTLKSSLALLVPFEAFHSAAPSYIKELIRLLSLARH